MLSASGGWSAGGMVLDGKVKKVCMVDHEGTKAEDNVEGDVALFLGSGSFQWVNARVEMFDATGRLLYGGVCVSR